MTSRRSEELFKMASGLIPGGVCSPVRAIKPYPFYVRSGSGSRIVDVDGNELIDYCMAYGPLLLGHAHPSVVRAIRGQAELGTVFGTPSELEVAYARKLSSLYGSMEMLRFASTGTEATMGAIRAARGFTGRDGVVMVEGGFHGSHDAVLANAGSGAAAMGIPASSGVPADVARHTLHVPFNDVGALEAILDARDDVACLIMEPVPGNMGPVLPRDGYLREVRRLTRDHGVLLIFDEVITGLRLGLSGAQGRYGVRPDMTTLGKIVGGGLPLGAFGGRRDVMACVAPSGSVYQAGTFNGNPLSLAAGMATVEFLETADAYARVDTATEELRRSIREIAGDAGVECAVGGVSSMFQAFFGKLPENYSGVRRCDAGKYLRFWRLLMESGVFLPPSQFETCFMSLAHGPEDLERTQEAVKKAMEALM